MDLGISWRRAQVELPIEGLDQCLFMNAIEPTRLPIGLRTRERRDKWSTCELDGQLFGGYGIVDEVLRDHGGGLLR
jgi:hypothetical protein